MKAAAITKHTLLLFSWAPLLFFYGAQKSLAASEDPSKPIRQILQQFDSDIAAQVLKAADKVRPVFSSEIKRATQKGDLDGALAIKQASVQFEERVKDLSAATAPAVSPVGKWHRPDGRVYVIEQGGKGIIVRGNEGVEPLKWEAVGAKFRISFPTLANTTNYIWPEKDNTWSFSWEDPSVKNGTLRRVD